MVKGFFILLSVFVFIYLMSPIVVLIGAAFNSEAYMAFPPTSFSIRWFQVIFEDTAFMSALWTSVKLGIISSVLSLLFGTLAAYGIERLPAVWRNGMNAFFMSPLQLPAIVLGIALFQLFKGLGVTMGFTTLLLGHLILCMPYAIRTVSAALFRFDKSVEEAALTLGASPLKTMWHVTMPMLKPSLIASAIFGFVVSFGNLSFSMFISSPRVNTLPVQIFGFVQYSPDPRIAAISAIVIVVTVVILYITEKFVGLNRMY
ncbi:ABC transporter permease [Paenibacillus terreus]|uniref:ABC transporter permease n=1 Tax=Paenibacillus terreus TaxID=1387834 RepID=A0ABV5B6A8_9BACL